MKATLIFNLVATILTISTSAYGSSCDSLKTSVTEDLSALNDKIQQSWKVGPLQTVSDDDSKFSKLLEKKYYRFGKDNKTRPELNAITGTGIISSTESEDLTKSIIGNGIMISDCYVLTNRHIVADLKPGADINNMNHRVNFSAGQAPQCEGFSAPKQLGTVVAHGKGPRTDTADWAIVKLDRRIDPRANVSKVKWDEEYSLLKNKIGLRIGHLPSSNVAELATAKAQIVSGLGPIGFGQTYRVSDKGDVDGYSGHGVFGWKEVKGSFNDDGTKVRELMFAGLHKGAGVVITMKNILSQIEAQDAEAGSDLAAKIRNNSCN